MVINDFGVVGRCNLAFVVNEPLVSEKRMTFTEGPERQCSGSAYACAPVNCLFGQLNNGVERIHSFNKKFRDPIG